MNNRKIKDPVSYRELTQEIRNLREHDILNLRKNMNARFDDIESCLDTKVDQEEFIAIEEKVSSNTTWRMYVTGAVAVVTSILGMIADNVIKFLKGE